MGGPPLGGHVGVRGRMVRFYFDNGRDQSTAIINWLASHPWLVLNVRVGLCSEN